jgi:hypothetical protein
MLLSPASQVTFFQHPQTHVFRCFPEEKPGFKASQVPVHLNTWVFSFLISFTLLLKDNFWVSYRRVSGSGQLGNHTQSSLQERGLKRRARTRRAMVARTR